MTHLIFRRLDLDGFFKGLSRTRFSHTMVSGNHLRSIDQRRFPIRSDSE